NRDPSSYDTIGPLSPDDPLFSTGPIRHIELADPPGVCECSPSTMPRECAGPISRNLAEGLNARFRRVCGVGPKPSRFCGGLFHFARSDVPPPEIPQEDPMAKVLITSALPYINGI